jgi:hypothetical protein
MSYRDCIQITPSTKAEADVKEEEKLFLLKGTFEQNLTNLARLGAILQTTGQLDFENNDSTTENCKIKILTTAHGSGYLEVDDVVIIAENDITADARIWRVAVTVVDQLSFTDSNLLDGKDKLTDYDTLITGNNDLWIWIVNKKYLITWITKQMILLKKTSATGGAHALNDNVIPTDTTFAGADKMIKEVLEYLYSRACGALTLLSSDETQETGTETTDVKSYDLPDNNFSKIRLNTDGFIRIEALTDITSKEIGYALIELYNGETEKAQQKVTAWVDAVGDAYAFPFSLTTIFEQKTTATVKVKISIVSGDHVLTTYWCNRFEVVGIW